MAATKLAGRRTGLSTFAVDKKGLAKLLRKKGMAFAVVELIQNAFDENTTTVLVDLERVTERKWKLTVSDDNPEGFADLSHAYTLFAESKKKDNPEKRGRFNLGEKLVIAVCDNVKIATTKGTVTFDDDGRHHSQAHTDVGTIFQGEVVMTQEEVKEVGAVIETLIVPKGIDLFYCERHVLRREPIHTFSVTLPTLKADEEGNLTPTRRKTTVEVFEPLHRTFGTVEIEPPRIFEMGLPVVANDSRWDMNVQQKVPLNMDRDNVTPSYLRELRTAVVNEMASRLSEEDAAGTWVNDALTSDDITDEAVNTILTKRFGEKRVIYDPSDPEGSKIAMSEGYTVIPGRALPARAWASVRRSGGALPAGQVTPSPKPYSDDPNAPVREEYPREKWSEGMERIVAWTKLLGRVLLGNEIDVVLINSIMVPAFATFSQGGSFMEYNVGRLGKAWFDQDPRDPKVVRLIIHEFGHRYSGDHLSSEYYDALCDLGARLAAWAAENPGQWNASTNFPRSFHR